MLSCCKYFTFDNSVGHERSVNPNINAWLIINPAFISNMNTNFKVLHVTPLYMPKIGGVSIYVSNLATQLKDLNYDITIIAPKHIRKEIVPTDPPNIIRVPSIYFPDWPLPLKSASIPLDGGKKISKIIQRGCFDLIHIHGHVFPISLMAIDLAYKYKIPCILSILGTFGLNPHSLGGKLGLEKTFNKLFFSRALKKVNAVIGSTPNVTNYARSYAPLSLKYFTIPYGINMTQFRENISNKYIYRQKYNIQNDKIVILFSGRFEHIKGIIEFASAIKLLFINNPNIEVVIVGEGSLKDRVYSMLSDIPNVHLLKWQPQDKLHEIYLLSDMFVICSKTEGLPIALLEAMAASLHILYTPVGGIPDVLKEYASKTLIPRSTVEDIYNALRKSITDYDKFDKGQSNTGNVLDWKEVAIETDKAYKQIIGFSS
ncbi:glycosyltransferase family 4 protein [Candidatus Nitrosocosmicus franklandus]|uniref:Putative teichuronic acid biosynthesis glycosyltransferase TuaC n=1 Tax=Candidatus Nitrosocosmicus franklandianus TaxID=1798806 RepID=A0A484I412_9ARCH|nr:glycosyltransferase family 4 protein [Candidatus Nitrosocosmicus franklandus]VFJ12496.1 putative teichuronic acid biosynthesis glycosyltransferase TuaC [Candidatus Nitrosocosmicus franklandus]